jgi:hypothetical protein
VRERGLDEENRELRERLAQLEGTSDDEGDDQDEGEDDGSGSARRQQSARSRSRGDA